MEVKKLRHKWEIPLLLLGIILTIIVFIGCLIVIFSGNQLKDWAKGILLGILSTFFMIFIVKYFYWKHVVNRVEITDKQLPEVYSIYIDLAKRMEFKNIPKLYVYNGMGKLNAFASKCGYNSKYVVLYSDIVDIAYKNNEFDFLKFVLAHELAHNKCGHMDVWRISLSPILNLLQLGKTLTRAQEYTADRAALYYAPEGALKMIYLFSGKYVGKNINLEEYFRTVDENDKSLWVMLHNFLSDHAVGYRRMKTIKEATEKGWNIHGKML